MRLQEGQMQLAFLEIARRARRASDAAELAFIAVNDSALLAPYRQAALWFATGGVRALSGVVRPEGNAPYVLWLEGVCTFLAREQAEAAPIDVGALPEALRADWAEWLPAHAVWLPLAAAASPGEAALLAQGGGLLLVRETPWRPGELALLTEWAELWRHAWLARCASEPWSPARGWQLVRAHFSRSAGTVWWRQRWAAWLAIAIATTTVLVFAAFLIHLGSGGAWEQRTLIAMSLRSMVWIVIAAIGSRRLLRCKSVKI